MSKIEDNLPTEVLTALAEACGFQVVFDRAPGTDEWTLTAGRFAGPLQYDVQYVGTRQSVCAFLTGYASMQLQTTQILNDLDRAHQGLILDMRERLGR